MDKRTFVSIINFEEKNVLSNIYDKINLAEKTQQIIYTNEFLPPSVWKAILSFKNGFDINIYTLGTFEDSERRIMAFSKYDINIDEYPISLVKITNKSKFQTLKHKDYLGAIMSLGIKREKYGDMVLEGNSIYVAVCNDICDFLVQNLTFIGKCPCSVEILDNFKDFDIKPNSENILLNITSLRLDCVVSSICNFSRTKAVDLLDSGKVLLNYEEVKEKDKNIQNDDTMTIRGYGKYKIVEVIGTTQKGRLKLLIKKYI